MYLCVFLLIVPYTNIEIRKSKGVYMERFTPKITTDLVYFEYGSCEVDTVCMVADERGEFVRLSDVLELLQKYNIHDVLDKLK